MCFYFLFIFTQLLFILTFISLSHHFSSLSLLHLTFFFLPQFTSFSHLVHLTFISFPSSSPLTHFTPPPFLLHPSITLYPSITLSSPHHSLTPASHFPLHHIHPCIPPFISASFLSPQHPSFTPASTNHRNFRRVTVEGDLRASSGG